MGHRLVTLDTLQRFAYVYHLLWSQRRIMVIQFLGCGQISLNKSLSVV